jgi:glutaredoxin-dependent peroxiredoxin
MPLNTGTPAPDFTLINTKGEKISLRDFKGKPVVLLFFPFAYSSVCTTEMCDIRDNFNSYENLDAQVLGISTDSHYTLRAWTNDLKINFPLLSDFNKEASSKYDSLYEEYAKGKYDYMGVSKRSAFVIDIDGIIRYAEVCPTTDDQPDYEAIQKTLKEISGKIITTGK